MNEAHNNRSILLLDSGGIMDRAVKSGLLSFIEQQSLPWTVFSMGLNEWRAGQESGYFDDVPTDAFVGRIYDEGGAWARQRGIPVASWAFDQQSGPGMAGVAIDNASIGRVAAEHFQAAGFAHVAILQGQANPVKEARQEAFVHAARGLGLHVHMRQMFANGFQDRAGGERAVADWLLAQPGPLGVFCHQDRDAAWLLTLCHRFRLAVPKQIGVLGVDDSAVCDGTQPPLSSVRVPWALLGSALGMQVLRLLNGTDPGGPETHHIAVMSVHRRASTTRTKSYGSLVRQAMRLLGQSKSKTRSIQSVADDLGVAMRTLQRHFLEEVGCSPKHWLLRQQLERAEQLLLTTTVPVKEVGRRCGFADVAYFTRLFREQTGAPPGRFRDLHAARL